jgi:O-antigen/teichoic acid export membrane protein
MNSTTLTFGYSKSISVLLAIVALFFIFLPLSMPYVSGDQGTASPGFRLGSWIFSAVELLVAIYCALYKIQLTAGHLGYGLFVRRKIFFSDVKSAKYRSSPRADVIDITTNSGRKVSFTSSIDHFNDLWNALSKRLEPFGVHCE